MTVVAELLAVQLGPCPVGPLHGERPLERVEADDLPGASLHLDPRPHLGEPVERLAVLLVLVGETAHQPAADPGEPLWAQEELLLERKLKWDWTQLVEERPAAQGPPARPHLPQDPRRVAGPDLVELESQPERRPQLAEELPEVHPLGGGEVEAEEGPLEVELRPQEPHREREVGCSFLGQPAQLLRLRAAGFKRRPVLQRSGAGEARPRGRGVAEGGLEDPG